MTDLATYLDVDGRPALRFTRTYPHPQSRVWEPVTRPEQLGRHLQVLPPGHRGLDRGVLASQADVAADGDRVGRDVAASHPQPAAGRPQQRGDRPDERGFPGAIRPE